MENQESFTQQTSNAGGTGPDSAGSAGNAGEGESKANLGKRFLAALMDGVLTMVVGLVPVVGWLAGAAYWLVRDGLDLDFMDRRSIGKKVMGLRPVTLDGSPMDLVASARRNWTLALGGVASFLVAIPFLGWLIAIPVALAALAVGVAEIILVLVDPRGRRLGDRTGNSLVVEE